MEDKRFAVLIDSDNISAKYISGILDEMSKYGAVTYKRIYGDWTSPQTAKWRQELLENSIIPIQQFSNTIGKNATDSALIIDAMDILYANNVDGFCIVSSDGDFTRLASRLRESGMTVIGMGEEKTPRSFRAACSVFKSLEILVDEREETVAIDKNKECTKELCEKKNCGKQKGNTIPKASIESDIVNIITENENEGRTTGLGEIGSRLVKKYPDFDVRNYGYSLLSKFLEEMSGLELKKENTTFTVSLRENKKANAEIIDYICLIVKHSGKKGLDLGELSNKLMARYKMFNVRDYGYSKLFKFVQSIDGLDVRENGAEKKAAVWVGED